MLESRLADALGDAYALEGEIGRGGMGVVYKARDQRLKRPVAIKVLPPELAFRTDIRQRFMREAETAARLSHPHIVPIHAVSDANELVYFVMGLVDGESLALRLKRRGRLSIEEARRVMKETADALSAAHAQGVIHRDVKPDNILLEGTRGRVMVTDFGIAKALSTEGTLTEAGVAIGTPAFMSPEQAAGDKEIDGRSDLYSLGVVAYQMLTGELPFQAASVPMLLMKQITEDPVPVDRKRTETPKELSQTVMRCLAKDPEDRWPTADALRRALETSTFTAAPPRPGGTRARKPGSRDPGGPFDRARSSLDRAQDLTNRAQDMASRASRRSEEAARDWLESRGADVRRPSGRPSARLSRRDARYDRKLEAKEQEERDIQELAKKSGEPVIITRFRHRAATFAAVNGMLLLMNAVTTQFHPPWALFPLIGWGFGLAKDYAKLWTAGYSWKDVANRPPAPDAIEAKTAKGAARLAAGLPASIAEFGDHAGGIEQARSDRAAVMGMLDKMTKAERAMLPEIAPTVDQLLERATDLARSLSSLERDIDDGQIDKIDARLAALEIEPASSDSARRKVLLEQQKQKVEQLVARRVRLGEQLESSLLAMQNIRFDLLRLRSSGVAEALGDLTNATQQAKALSRDVDVAISAAKEVKKLTGHDSPPPPERA